MKRFQYLGPVLILLAGITLWLYRYHQTKHPSRSFSITEHGIVLDEPLFCKRVAQTYPRIGSTALHLVVFLDPIKDCPTCIGEFSQWVAPLADTEPGIYDLTLFVQAGLSEEELVEFLGLMGLRREHAVVFEPDDPLADFHRLGLFKVVVSQAAGVKWYEPGSRTPEAYRAFGRRLRETIREAQAPDPNRKDT